MHKLLWDGDEIRARHEAAPESWTWNAAEGCHEVRCGTYHWRIYSEDGQFISYDADDCMGAHPTLDAAKRSAVSCMRQMQDYLAAKGKLDTWAAPKVALDALARLEAELDPSPTAPHGASRPLGVCVTCLAGTCAGHGVVPYPEVDPATITCPCSCHGKAPTAPPVAESEEPT
jgi:hypothetical protein